MTAGNLSHAKKSIREQVIAILSLIFAVILISIIAIPQVLQALSRLIYWRRSRRNSEDVRGKFAVVRGKFLRNVLSNKRMRNLINSKNR